jgi:hypothetical protein
MGMEHMDNGSALALHDDTPMNERLKGVAPPLEHLPLKGR